MKIWLLSQSVHTGYDTYDSAVVAAETENEARQIHPDAKVWPKVKYHGAFCTWAETPDQVDVTLIGEAAPDVDHGLILASFNNS